MDRGDIKKCNLSFLLGGYRMLFALSKHIIRASETKARQEERDK